MEAGAEKWTGLIDILEELWLCVKLKDEELTQQRPVGEDVHTLLQQQGYYTVSHTACMFTASDCKDHYISVEGEFSTYSPL